MKRILITGLRVLGCVVAFIVLFMVATSLTTPAALAEQMSPEDLARSAQVLPLISLIMAGLLSYLALRSRWHGWKLAVGLFVVFYGVYTFLSQIETLAFPAVSANLPPGTVPGFFLSGLVIGIPFSLLAVWILGKARAEGALSPPPERLPRSAGEWAWKLAVAVLLYEAVYFSFGYFVAWRTPGLPEFYGGSDPGSLLGQLGNVMRDTPWLPVFQAARALVWTGLAAVVIRMHKGGTFETALATGLTFSLLMTTPLLFPNPIMPAAVVRGHTIELFWSNLLFGFLVTLLLVARPRKG